MNIAITGFRGIPAKYGGFETFIEELAPRLVEKGHSVTVYGRSNIIKYKEKFYKGVKIEILPTISHKYFDTVVHTFLSLLHCSFKKYDIIFVVNAANSPLMIIPRLAGKKTVLNVDGIERLRKKWNIIGKLYYRIGEFCAVKFPNVIVSDADVIKKYYLETYKKDSVMIPYGAYIEKISSKEILNKYNLAPKEYILYVSRLEPENNADKVIKAYVNLNTDKKLVIVGDAPYSDEYKSYLKELAKDDPRIIFTGYVFGNGYKEFQSNAYCYIQATEVGGTHPALIESMGVGNCVIANGTEENIEVLGDTGLIYKKNDVEDLRDKLYKVLNDKNIVELYGQKAAERISQYYTWESVTIKYEKLFLNVIKTEV